MYISIIQSNKMESLDKITLELLINKNQYNKYLSKEDPKKFEEHKTYLEKIRKYKKKILKMTHQFLENPDVSINLEINEMFSIYFKTFIKYFDMQEVEMNNFYNFNEKNENEEDTLFGKIDENKDSESEGEEDEQEQIDEKKSNKDNFKLDECIILNNTMQSFWGKNIKKL
jgi:hypothetical protein